MMLSAVIFAVLSIKIETGLTHMAQNLIWQMPENSFDRSLKKFRHYLTSNGYRSSTIDGYVDRIGRYLKFAKTDRPLPEDATKFRDSLLKKNPARNTLNNYRGFRLTSGCGSHGELCLYFQ